MDSLECPYCGQQKHDDPANCFIGCRFCGFKSALVPSNDGMLLIVDRQMPYLQRRCDELTESNPEVKIVVDRRIVQDPQEVPDRRLVLEADEIQQNETTAGLIEKPGLS
ncbi:MAG: hypothetical protein JJD96_04850 [Thermoleophilia bacterium]|nr:hypothetical protein [Thermoleophilia bacterium]